MTVFDVPKPCMHPVQVSPVSIYNNKWAKAANRYS
jgi:hypothetical protein